MAHILIVFATVMSATSALIGEQQNALMLAGIVIGISFVNSCVAIAKR